jgi:hypothetical protein
MKKLALVVLIGLMAILPTFAQENITNPTLLERFLGSSRETILNRKLVGPYTVSVSGERFPDKGYFLLDISAPDGVDLSTVQVAATFEGVIEYDPQAEEQEMTDPITREAVYQEGLFVINPIPTEGAETWLVTLNITDASDTYTSDFVSVIWPRSPELPVPLAIGALAFPLVLMGLVLLGFRQMNTPLMRPQLVEG